MPGRGKEKKANHEWINDLRDYAKTGKLKHGKHFGRSEWASEQKRKIDNCKRKKSPFSTAADCTCTYHPQKKQKGNNGAPTARGVSGAFCRPVQAPPQVQAAARAPAQRAPAATSHVGRPGNFHPGAVFPTVAASARSNAGRRHNNNNPGRGHVGRNRQAGRGGSARGSPRSGGGRSAKAPPIVIPSPRSRARRTQDNNNPSQSQEQVGNRQQARAVPGEPARISHGGRSANVPPTDDDDEFVDDIDWSSVPMPSAAPQAVQAQQRSNIINEPSPPTEPNRQQPMQNSFKPIQRKAPVPVSAPRPRSPPPPAPSVVPTNWPKKPPPMMGVNDIKGKTRTYYTDDDNVMNLTAFGPTTGTCIHPGCNSAVHYHMRNETPKMIYSEGFPRWVQGCGLKCNREKVKHSCFQSFRREYIESVTAEDRVRLRAIVVGKGKGVDMNLILRMRLGETAAKVSGSCRASLQLQYAAKKRTWIDKAERLRKHGCVVVTEDGEENFPPFPEEWVPSPTQLNNAFIADGMFNKYDLKRELAAVTSDLTLAIDHQRKVAKTAKLAPGEMHSQTLCAMGDNGLCLNLVCCPDTSKKWSERMMLELIERHGEAGLPKFCYVDCQCCNSRPGGGGPEHRIWHGMILKLDIMHCIMRIARECNSEHPRKAAFLRSLSQAFYTSCAEDVAKLEKIRKEKGLKLSEKEKKADRTKYVRRIVKGPEEVAREVLLTVKTHMAIDKRNRDRWEATGASMADLTIAHPASALIRPSVLKSASLQMVHILNGCVSDDAPMHRKVGVANYRDTGEEIPVYMSDRGTPKCEALHSVAGLKSSAWRNIRSTLWDTRMIWIVIHYNRAILRRMGKKVLPDGVAPSEGDPDLVIMAKHTTLLFGMEYCRAVVADLKREISNLTDAELFASMEAGIPEDGVDGDTGVSTDDMTAATDAELGSTGNGPVDDDFPEDDDFDADVEKAQSGVDESLKHYLRDMGVADANEYVKLDIPDELSANALAAIESDLAAQLSSVGDIMEAAVREALEDADQEREGSVSVCADTAHEQSEEDTGAVSVAAANAGSAALSVANATTEQLEAEARTFDSEAAATFDQLNAEANAYAAEHLGLNVGEHFRDIDLDQVKDSTSKKCIAKRRNVGKQGYAYPCTFNDTMANKWRELYITHNSKCFHDFIKAVWKEYHIWALKHNADAQKAGDGRERALGVTFDHITHFVEEEKARNLAPLESGGVDELTNQFVENLARHQQAPERSEGLDFDSGMVSVGDMNVHAPTAGNHTNNQQAGAKPSAMGEFRKYVPARSKPKKAPKPKDPDQERAEKEMDERKARAQAAKDKMGLEDDIRLPRKRNMCHVCHMYNDATLKYSINGRELPHLRIKGILPHGKEFRWCPFADDLSMAEEALKAREKKEGQRYQRKNQVRKQRNEAKKRGEEKKDDSEEYVVADQMEDGTEVARLNDDGQPLV